MIELLGNDSTTNNIELDAAGQYLFGDRWKGVFASDTWTDNHDGRFAIVNLSKSTSGGSHWVAFNGFYWYDSLKNNGVLWDVEQTQSDDLTCGQRCLSYLLLFEEDETLAELL